MLLLLLLVTPLVNAVHDSWPSPSPSPCPCTCALPEPVRMVNSTECINGTWYGMYSTANRSCYSVLRIDNNGDNKVNLSLTQTTENECSQTIVTYYGTATLGANNILTRIYPCRSTADYTRDLVILATDCKNYMIIGRCRPGTCEPEYLIAFTSDTPSDCTIKQVEKDLKCLGMCLDDFPYRC